jgi:hypothetical protein
VVRSRGDQPGGGRFVRSEQRILDPPGNLSIVAANLA